MPIPRFVAGFNKHVTNKIILIFAVCLLPFAVMGHVGRRSGSSYRTPVLVFQAGEGYVVALTYGRDVDWVRNLLAAGYGKLERGGLRMPVSSFSVASYGDKECLFPLWVRLLLSLISVKDCLYMEKIRR